MYKIVGGSIRISKVQEDIGYDSFRRFGKFQEGPRSSKKVQEIQKGLRDSKRSKNVREAQKGSISSIRFKKVQDGLRRFNMVHVGSKRYKKVKKG